MLRSLIHSAFYVFIAFSAVSQPIADEWIDYNKKYLKIACWEKGLYELNYADLNQAFNAIGVNLGQIPIDELKLYRNGVEQSLHLRVDNDSVLEPGESVLFLGSPNDGVFDTSLYLNSEQAHRFYSLFNDTAYYFLTWEAQTKRYNQIQVQTAASNLPYVWYRQLEVYTSGYQYGERNFFGSTDPEYRMGEGYFDGGTGSGSFAYQAGRNKVVPSRNVYRNSGAPQAMLKSIIIPVIGSRHRIELSIPSPFKALSTSSWLGSDIAHFSLSMNVSDLGNTQTTFRFSSLATNPAPTNNTARYAISHFDLRYPHELNLSNQGQFSFELDPQNDSVLLSFSNALPGKYYAFNKENNYLIEVNSQASSLNLRLPPSSQSIEINLYHESAIQSPGKIVSAGRNGVFHNYGSFAPDSAFLIVTHPKLLNAANIYAAYKESQEFKPLVVNVEELYEQYAYGIKQHPLAIKNFCRRALESWSSDPRFLFLMGKGISAHLTRNNALNYQNNLVPTFGFPSCDNLFTTRINGSLYDPIIPTGRLSAKSPQDVLDYLQKIEEFNTAVDSISENANAQLWKKRILHFAGGTSELEQSLFERYLNNYRNIAQDSLFAGKVFTFYKNSSAAIQTDVSDSVKLLIDDGVALMTFFGHGAGGQLGFSIGDPQSYANEGKYPFMIANSCNVGNIYLEDIGSRSLNEEFILSKQRGVIGFISSVENGYPYNLDEYTNAFYRNFSKRHYGKSIGELMQQTVRDIQRESAIVKWTCLEMSLHGDPSLGLYPIAKTELHISDESVRTEPEKLSVDLDSFRVQVRISNTGKATSAVFPVRLFHRSSAGIDTVYVHFQKGINLSAEVVFTIPLDQELMAGENNFSIEIDLPENTVVEQYDFTNNVVTFDRLITSDELIPVFPPNFAVVPDSFPSLIAYTSEMHAPRREYYFQADTTDSFDSPVLVEKLLVSDGGIVRWAPEFKHWDDSVVYFWRCSPNNFYAKDMKWRERSFQYIEGKSGRGQASFNQFKENRFQFLSYEREKRRSEFVPVSRKLSVKNRGNPSFGAEFQELYDILFRLDGVIQGQGVCNARRSMHIAIIDPISLECWGNDRLSLGQFNESGACSNFLPKQFMFDVLSPGDLDSMARLLEHYVPNGHYILAFSGINARFQDSTYWKDNHFQAFENLGADSIRHIPSLNPYIFFCQKGNQLYTHEILGKSEKDVLNFEIDLESRSSFGFIETPRFTNIDTIALFSGYVDTASNDLVAVSLLNAGEAAYEHAYSKWYVDSLKDYSSEHLSLLFRFEDNLLRSAPQLKFWHILGDELPELAINPQISSEINANYFKEGDSLKLQLGFENLSPANMPEYYIRISALKRSSAELSTLYYQPQASLEGGLNRVLNWSFSTENMSGSYVLFVELNPKDSNWVKELEHFNNKTEYLFFVEEDQLNPILDVRFDGRYIQDYQYIESNPDISLSIYDNRKFQSIDDTSNLELWLAYEDEDFQPIYHGTGALSPSAEAFSKGIASYLFQPSLNEGLYRLRARAKDVKGTPSGEMDYLIHFQVQEEKGLEALRIYPNPFRSSTRILLDIRGAEVPTDLMLEISNSLGKIVKQIDVYSAYKLHIGENLLDFYWDGKDMDGQALPAGTYFYRLSSESLNTKLSLLETSGKIILIK